VASSNHAVGLRTRGAEPLADDVPVLPDSPYGVSKAAGEALSAFYSLKYSMDVICLRIGSCFDKPENRRMLSTWLSPADFVRLTKAALETQSRDSASCGACQRTRGAGGPLWAGTP